MLGSVPPDVDPGIVHYNNDQAEASFEFNHVFDVDATQEDVFEEVAATKVMQVLAGVNCTVFAYGQTGSGKTSLCLEATLSRTEDHSTHGCLYLASWAGGSSSPF